jgi:glycine/D-amino acid oxidase-like deaminating enzyme
MFPNLDLEIGYAWAGTFSYTEDGLPIIGERTDAPGQWLALGYGGNGITFGAIAARLISQALSGQAPDELRLFG